MPKSLATEVELILADCGIEACSIELNKKIEARLTALVFDATQEDKAAIAQLVSALQESSSRLDPSHKLREAAWRESKANALRYGRQRLAIVAKTLFK